MEYRSTTIFISILLFNIININCQICQQQIPHSTPTPSIQQSDFSFCCCRNVRSITTPINSNTTTTHYSFEIKISPIFTIYQNITNTTTSLFNSNQHVCLLETRVLTRDTNVTEECHCTNTYADLEQHRISQGYTCPKPKVVIGAFLDLNSTNGIEMLKAAQLAVHEVNQNVDYFPKYEVVLDIGGNSTNKHLHNFASQILLNHLVRKPPPVFFLGPENNLLAKTVASVAGLKAKNVVQFSVNTDDLHLSHKRDVYPNFYRLNPSVYHFNAARVEILKHYKWLRVGLIYSSDAFHSQMNSVLREMLIGNNISVVFEDSFHNETTTTINAIKKNGVKVILGSFDNGYSSQIFCQIYCLEMFSPRYVWLMTQNSIPSATSVCSAEQVGCAMRHQFFFSLKSHPDPSLIHIANHKTSASFDSAFRKLMAPSSYDEKTSLARYTYDAVWTMFDILKRAKPSLEVWNINFDRIYFGDTLSRRLLKDLTKTTDYNGITRRIRFDSHGNLYNDVSVYQSLTGANLDDIGVYEIEHNVLRLRSVHWLGWRPHQDMVTKKTYRLLSYSLHLAMFILALIGVAFSLILFIYVLVKRKHEYVRNTYWKINILVIFGAIMVYISLFFFLTEPESNILSITGDTVCLLRTILFCLGFSFILGVLFAKLYLAYKIWNKNWSNLRSKLLKRLFVWWFLIVLVTCLILLFWCLVNPFKMMEKVIEKREKIHCSTISINFDPFYEEFIYINICHHFSYGFALAILWFVVIICISIHLFIKARHLFISNLSDTWHCGICVAVIAVFAVAGVVCGFLLSDYPDLFGSVVGTLIWVCVTLVLIILFLHLLLNSSRNCCRRINWWLKKLCCCACCPSCCTKSCGSNGDDLSQQEDIFMFQQYHQRLSPDSRDNSGVKSGNASLKDISLNDSLSQSNNKKSKKKGCCGCCGNSFSHLFFGHKDAARSNEDNNKNGRDHIVRRKWKKKRNISVQTEGQLKKPFKKCHPFLIKYAIFGLPGAWAAELLGVIPGVQDQKKEGIDLLANKDIGDGLKLLEIKDDEVKKVALNTGPAPPLKIYDKKPDWSNVKSYLKVSGVINTWKSPDKRKFGSTGDIKALRKIEASSLESPVLVNKHAKSSTNLAINDSSPVKSGGGRRGTVSIPTFKHDYSHVKSSVNSGLSHAQSRRMSKIPDTGTPEKSKNRENRLITNNNQDKPQKKNKADSKPLSSVKVKVSPPPSADQPIVRIVNGPGSLPMPEQPKNQFLKKYSPELKGVTVTSLATTESKL